MREYHKSAANGFSIINPIQSLFINGVNPKFCDKCLKIIINHFNDHKITATLRSKDESQFGFSILCITIVGWTASTLPPKIYEELYPKIEMFIYDPVDYETL